MYSPLNRDALDSTVTLVDTSAFGVPQTVISFIRDDMKNTKIYSADDRLLYTVETDKATNTHTIVYREDSRDVVAEVKRKDLRPDKIKFADSPALKLSDWLHGSNNKWSDFPVSFEWRSVKYTWMTNSLKQIALYKEDEQFSPIAWFQTSTKRIIDDVPTMYRALLALQPAAQDALDGIVISLLVVEYGLRLRGTRYGNADGRAAFKHCGV